MPNPRGPRGQRRIEDSLGAGDLLGIIDAYTRLGGHQVNLTGGEPLAHPELWSLLLRLPKRASRVVLNTNAVLAPRLLERPALPTIDGILASLHTTDEALFRRHLGGRHIERVMRHIAALARHGYAVTVNYSLGDYNKEELGAVLDFVLGEGIALKVIALVRPHEGEGFYGGEWIDPGWVDERLAARGGRVESVRDAFGGQKTAWRVGSGDVLVEVKNIARGRLATTFCDGCAHLSTCGEGIYGLRVGVDGVWKPCLMRQDRFRPVTRPSAGGETWEAQILSLVHAMIGRWPEARFQAGAPA